jgi:phage N-6-adenine-methyltransferase
VNSALMFSKASDEWETPRELFDTLNAEFGFAIDVAATEDNALCFCRITEHVDALQSEHWRGFDGFRYHYVAWMNPPYSKCRQFIAKAAYEAKKGTTVVALVPSRTDTRWWHEHVWDSEKHQPRPGVEVRFNKGRLKFGNSQNSAPFPSVVIVFRPVVNPIA